MFRKTLLILFFLLLPAGVFAAYPAPKGYVNDFAGVINPQTKSGIENMLSSFERASGDEIAVVTLPSLDGEPVENVAINLYKEWGIGKKGKDNGLLFLIAPTDRQMRVEVGYGLEGVINDALAGRLLDENVMPRFKSGDLSGGIAVGAIAIVQTITAKEGIAFDAMKAFGGSVSEVAPAAQKRGPLSMALKVLFFIFMAYLFIRHPWLFLFFLSSMGGGGRSSGGFSGGFGGFGGGMSGGGGASRSW